MDMLFPLPTPREMGVWDAMSHDEVGIPPEMLMENASRAALEVLLAETGPVHGKAVLVVAGPGNNGGDALALARHLHDLQARVLVLHTRPEAGYSGISGMHLQIARKAGVELRLLDASSPASLPAADIVIDGLLGTGLRDALKPAYAELVQSINALGKTAFVLALDIPSGLDGRHGQPLPVAVRANVTVTFEAAKPGLVLPGSRDYVGRLHVRPIGIPLLVKRKYPARCGLLNDAVGSLIPAAAPDLHKGQAGHVLVIGGSVGLTGAPLLAALGALRAGAGLVTVACPADLAIEIKAGHPEIMTLPLGRGQEWEPDAASALLSGLDRFDALVLGPGLGRAPGALRFLEALLPGQRPPMVLDADGLYWLAGEPALFGLLSDRDVVTPHYGEMARLVSGQPSPAELPFFERIDLARRFARQHRLTTVLKGACSIVAGARDGLALSPFSEPNLAVAGSGDVLAGLLGALLGRGLAPWQAACLAVYVHGRCGAMLRTKYPLRGNLTREIAHAIPCALEELHNAYRQRHHDPQSGDPHARG